MVETLNVLLVEPMPTGAVQLALPGRRLSLSALNNRLRRLAALGLAVRVETESGYAWRRA